MSADEGLREVPGSGSTGDRSIPSVLYWDASAVLSVLFQDSHSAEAAAWVGLDSVHLLSSLSLAETHAVIARVHHERALAGVLVNAALESLATGPWHLVRAVPDRDVTKSLALRWPLRGADLWHLALVKTLQPELPEIRLLTFDRRLGDSAFGEGLAWPVAIGL